jgi:acyl-CoA thioesterase FadM
MTPTRGAPTARGATAEPPFGITIPYRVRFDESGPDGTVRTSALVRYAQDVAWLHSERLGFDRAWYADRGLTWLVRSIELVVEGVIETGTALAVTTRIAGYRRVWARRRTSFTLPGGTAVAWAHTDWVIVDARGVPTRMPDDFARLYTTPPGPFDPVRIVLPEPSDDALEWHGRVRRADLDPLAHVNNAAYLDYFEEAISALDGGGARLAALPRTYRLEYVAVAEPGWSMTGRLWELEPGPGRSPLAFRLAADDGTELLRALFAG